MKYLLSLIPNFHHLNLISFLEPIYKNTSNNTAYKVNRQHSYHIQFLGAVNMLRILYIYIYQPLCINRMWRKGFFSVEFNRLEFWVFLLKDGLAYEPSLPSYLPLAGRRIVRFMPFPRVLTLSRIWSRVTKSISYDEKYYTTCESLIKIYLYMCLCVCACVRVYVTVLAQTFQNILLDAPLVTNLIPHHPQIN